MVSRGVMDCRPPASYHCAYGREENRRPHPKPLGDSSGPVGQEMVLEKGDPRLPQRFWNKVEESTSGCWLWTASTSAKGYGHYYFECAVWQAHRASYTALVKDIPKGLQMDHLCRVRNCVNPYHLEPVSSRENTRRSPIHCGNKTHCPKGHEYAGENLVIGKYNKRYCRQCRAISNAKIRQLKQWKEAS